MSKLNQLALKANQLEARFLHLAVLHTTMFQNRLLIVLLSLCLAYVISSLVEFHAVGPGYDIYILLTGLALAIVSAWQFIVLAKLCIRQCDCHHKLTPGFRQHFLSTPALWFVLLWMLFSITLPFWAITQFPLVPAILLVQLGLALSALPVIFCLTTGRSKRFESDMQLVTDPDLTVEKLNQKSDQQLTALIKLAHSMLATENAAFISDYLHSGKPVSIEDKSPDEVHLLIEKALKSGDVLRADYLSKQLLHQLEATEEPPA